MFGNKLPFMNSGKTARKPDTLPVDFGAMYYLLPLADARGSELKPNGYTGKLVARMKTYFKKTRS